jgi:uncharacterized protein (DUF1697 family)
MFEYSASGLSDNVRRMASSTYIALLRGINVSTKRLAMADLRAAYASLGLGDVRTLLNSGNVVFSASSAVDAAALEAAVLDRTGISSRTVLIAAEKFRAIAAAVPYRDKPNYSRVIVTFFESMPTALAVPDVAGPELIAADALAVYQWLPEGVLASTVPPAFTRSLGLVTARNLRTVDKIVALLS